MEFLAPSTELRMEAVGDRSLQIVLGDRIDPGVNDQVHHLAAIIHHKGLPGIRDLVPAYATLTVHYDPVLWAGTPVGPHAALAKALADLWQEADENTLPPPRRVEIPVCYGGAFGPDLDGVAEHCQLPGEEIISRHSASEYRVYMLGFAPGFAYLGGLDPVLAAPRRETPRLRVPAGSVGIAGMQTGIYPLETPGGWQIIGRTPRRLFKPSAEEPCLLRPGDLLRFVAIDETTFQILAEERR